MKRNTVYFFLAACLTVASCNNSTEKSDGKGTTEATKEVVYTCPMHPEVTSAEPGTCPKCNMDLEKKE